MYCYNKAIGVVTMLKIFITFFLLLSGCVTAPTTKERKRQNTLKCVVRLLDEDVSVKDAYLVCGDIYNPKQKKKRKKNG